MSAAGAILFYVLLVVSSAAYGYFVGRAKARRSRELWTGLKQGKPESYAVIAVVAAVVGYTLWTYKPPSARVGNPASSVTRTMNASR